MENSADRITALINQLTDLTPENFVQNESSKNIQFILSSGVNNDVKELYLKNLVDAQKYRIIAENEKKKSRIEETLAGFLKQKGLPPLRKSKESIFTPGYGNHSFNLESVDHVKDVVIGVPSCCNISELEDLPSLIWNQTESNMKLENDRMLLKWTDEAEIENFIYIAIVDIIKLLKLNPRVEVSRQVKITLVEHLTPDIMFMELNVNI